MWVKLFWWNTFPLSFSVLSCSLALAQSKPHICTPITTSTLSHPLTTHRHSCIDLDQAGLVVCDTNVDTTIIVQSGRHSKRAHSCCLGDNLQSALSNCGRVVPVDFGQIGVCQAALEEQLSAFSELCALWLREKPWYARP